MPYPGLRDKCQALSTIVLVGRRKASIQSWVRNLNPQHQAKEIRGLGVDKKNIMTSVSFRKILIELLLCCMPEYDLVLTKNTWNKTWSPLLKGLQLPKKTDIKLQDHMEDSTVPTIHVGK